MALISYEKIELSNKKFLIKWSNLTPGSNPPVDTDVGQGFDSSNSTLLSIHRVNASMNVDFYGSNEEADPTTSFSPASPGNSVKISAILSSGSNSLKAPDLLTKWCFPAGSGSSGSADVIALFEEI